MTEEQHAQLEQSIVTICGTLIRLDSRLEWLENAVLKLAIASGKADVYKRRRDLAPDPPPSDTRIDDATRPKHQPAGR